MRKNQKGFTLVELLVVIAILAILATVAVVGYTSFINKANQSVDEQAVAQINKALEALEVDGKFTDVAQVIKALDKMDLDIEDYKPLKSGMYFYWDAGLNRVVYADENDNIVFPKDTEKKGQWMSLSGIVPMDSDYTISTEGKVTIDSGAQLVHLMQQISENKATATEIVLSNDVDLRGASVNFGKITESITISASSPVTISGIRTDDNVLRVDSGTYAGDKYGYGLFGEIPAGKKVTLKNITISNMIVGDAKAKTVGLIAGYINGELEMINVSIENCVVNGYQKVGAIVGQLHGTLTMNGVTFTNTEVNGEVEVAKIAGIISKTGCLTVTGGDFSNITTRCLKNDGQIILTKSKVGNNLVGDSENIYEYYEGYKAEVNGSPTEYITLFGAVTNDWAWYSVGENVVMNIKIENDDYTMCGTIYSASKNFVSGVPQN